MNSTNIQIEYKSSINPDVHLLGLNCHIFHFYHCLQIKCSSQKQLNRLKFLKRHPRVRIIGKASNVCGGRTWQIGLRHHV